MSNQETINKANAENFKWGTACDGWHLLKSDELSIVEEIMPPGSKGVVHHHEVSRHFFYVLEGEASLVIDGTTHLLNRGDSILVLPGKVHQIKNESGDELNFLVVSSPECFTDKHS
ncbi:MAG: cupin domain-containing protein [Symploca sp. SIO1C2]|nr:cupin domain-containing protein [Symploca sp. SIO1C2]